MASYSSLVYSEYGDGWTEAYSIDWPSASNQDKGNISYYTNISNYSDSPVNASWFQHSWWVDYYNDSGTHVHLPRCWSKIYHNTSGMSLAFSGITFLACAGHSNGHSYLSGSGGLLSASYGQGATFRARYYVSNNSEEYCETDTYVVPDVTESTFDGKSGDFLGNICRVDGKGAPAMGESSDNEAPYFGGCGRGWYVGDDQLLKYVNTKKFGPNTVVLDFEDPVVIPNDEYAFLNVEVTDWHGGSELHQLLVMLAEEPYFTSTPITPSSPYIWRMTDMEDGTRQWQKTRYAFQWSGTDWVKLDNN